MRWFKHMTNARDDAHVSELMLKWGSDGYTAWFATMEIVAGQGVRKVSKRGKGRGRWAARFRAAPMVYSRQCGIPPDRLETIYEFCAKKKKFRFIRSRDSWIIDWPKVLEFKDEWTEKQMPKGRKKLGSNSGATRVGFASASASVSGAGSSLGEEGAGGRGKDGALAKLCDEFTSLTGRAPLVGVGDPAALVERLRGLVSVRGLDPMLRIMRQKASECQTRTGRPPNTIQYFVPIFEDDRLFTANGGSNGKGTGATGEFRLTDDEVERLVTDKIARREGRGAG